MDKLEYHKETLKDLMDSYNWDENNIPIDLVESLIDLRKRLLSIKKPIFTQDGIPVMDNFEEFQYCGMSNIDYISTGFYKDGYGVNELYLNENID